MSSITIRRLKKNKEREEANSIIRVRLGDRLSETRTILFIRGDDRFACHTRVEWSAEQSDFLIESLVAPELVPAKLELQITKERRVDKIQGRLIHMTCRKGIPIPETGRADFGRGHHGGLYRHAQDVGNHVEQRDFANLQDGVVQGLKDGQRRVTKEIIIRLEKKVKTRGLYRKEVFYKRSGMRKRQYRHQLNRFNQVTPRLLLLRIGAFRDAPIQFALPLGQPQFMREQLVFQVLHHATIRVFQSLLHALALGIDGVQQQRREVGLRVGVEQENRDEVTNVTEHRAEAIEVKGVLRRELEQLVERVMRGASIRMGGKITSQGHCSGLLGRGGRTVGKEVTDGRLHQAMQRLTRHRAEPGLTWRTDLRRQQVTTRV